MAISRERKEELVAQYADLIQRSNVMILAEYGGMSVQAMEKLREEVRKANGALYVTKNTLIRYALEQAQRPAPEELFMGQVAMGFALEEVPALAKALVDYAKAEERLRLKAAILGDKVLSAEQVEALAKLPSLDELRAQISGLINAPAQNVVSAITNGVRQVINVIDAYARQEEGEGEGAAAAEAA